MEGSEGPLPRVPIDRGGGIDGPSRIEVIEGPEAPIRIEEPRAGLWGFKDPVRA
jgi:hypothetical protein